jgi:phospholipase C
MRSFLSTSLVTALVLGTAIDPQLASAADTATPIKHIVIIFGENISFDHYFGTYPKAVNPPGQPAFHALPGTPAVNGLTHQLLTDNPNLNPLNGVGASNPFRLNRSQAQTADQNHDYGPEQAAYDNGLMDLFPLNTGTAGPPPVSYPAVTATPGLVMGYYDGNSVTALWNYAQHYALNDNSFTSTFGPSTPGAINLISGQTNGIIDQKNGPSSDVVSDGQGGFTMVGDADPIGDVCSTSTGFTATLGGKNIGDLLNAADVTWGWFQGGFDLSITNPNGTTGCKRSTVSPITGLTENDNSPHHEPFQYYKSTRNEAHTRPSSLANIGHTDGANHQYDIRDWFNALAANNLPAVSYLKAARYQDGHPGNSNPLDEQAFIVKVVNAIQNSPFWSSTAVVIHYDDSDGWYDHQMPATVNGSRTSQDALNGAGVCGGGPTLPGPFSKGKVVQGRCGYGTRVPLLVISPYAKVNFIDHTTTDQTATLRFIEDNWLSGERIGQGSFDTIGNSIAKMFDFSASPHTAKYLLSPITGQPQ